jgi:hypothetical protein
MRLEVTRLAETGSAVPVFRHLRGQAEAGPIIEADPSIKAVEQRAIMARLLTYRPGDRKTLSETAKF